MAYKTKDLYKEALEILKEDDSIMFIEHLVSLMPCDRGTFYNHFPIDLDNFNTIKGIIDKNKVSRKSKMYQKWFDSDHPTLQVALMKLISTDEEAHRLNGSSQKLDSTNKQVIQYENVSKQFPDKE